MLLGLKWELLVLGTDAGLESSQVQAVKMACSWVGTWVPPVCFLLDRECECPIPPGSISYVLSSPSPPQGLQDPRAVLLWPLLIAAPSPMHTPFTPDDPCLSSLGARIGSLGFPACSPLTCLLVLKLVMAHGSYLSTEDTTSVALGMDQDFSVPLRRSPWVKGSKELRRGCAWQVPGRPCTVF